MSADAESSTPTVDTLDDLEKERKMVESGTHPTLQERVSVFEAERRDKEDKATLYRKWQVKVAKEMERAEIMAAHQAFETSVELAKTDLLKQVTERIEQLQSRQKLAPTRGMGRTLRSKVKDATSTAQAVMADPTMYPLRHALDRDDIMDDLRAVFSDWRQAAARFQKETVSKLLPTRVEGRVLHFCDRTFRRGDSVVVISELTVQEFPGVFMGANPVEAGVLLPDGTRCRIPLVHLRQGRITIRPDGEPDVATLQLLESIREAQFPPPATDPPRPNASITGVLPAQALERARQRRRQAQAIGRQAEADARAQARAQTAPKKHQSPAPAPAQETEPGEPEPHSPTTAQAGQQPTSSSSSASASSSLEAGGPSLPPQVVPPLQAAAAAPVSTSSSSSDVPVQPPSHVSVTEAEAAVAAALAPSHPKEPESAAPSASASSSSSTQGIDSTSNAVKREREAEQAPATQPLPVPLPASAEPVAPPQPSTTAAAQPSPQASETTATAAQAPITAGHQDDQAGDGDSAPHEPKRSKVGDDRPPSPPQQ